MRKIPSSNLIALALMLLAGSGTASAGRAVRIAFDDWSEAQPIGSPACPGTTAGSTVVNWNGFLLVGSDDPKYLTDAYCQTSLAGEFDENSFNGENSAVVGRLVGINGENRVTAIRYTFLDRDRFDAEKEGYQWVVYSFPDVRLIGLNSSANYALTPDTHIAHEIDSSSIYWSADQYPDGEYLCIIPSGQPSYYWSQGALVDSIWQFSAQDDFSAYNQNGCVKKLTGAYANSFEDPQ